ncbi:MAG: hypothetical protein KF829_11285 [Ferruginibacter sp.]|nr:hypothetical protein [Ferruginibacter sp.]
MKRQDVIKPFVHNFIKNTGYPAWQHVKINISRPAYQSAEPESDTLVTVPIVKEGASYLSGVLAILVNSEVWYKLLEGIKYYELPIEESGTSTEEIFTVLDFFKMMMSLEYEMFGQNEFVITDEELLNRLSPEEPEIYYGTQLSFSNGCTIFNYGYYTSSGFTITSTESLCLYEPAGLVYMLTVPESGGGGSTSGTESGTPGSTNTDNEECKRGFVGVTEFDEQGEPVLPCSITLDSTILRKLHDDQVAIKNKRDSIWNLARAHNWEYYFFGIKNGNGVIDTLGVRTDEDPNNVKPNRRVLQGRQPIFDWHSHQDSLPKDRHPHDPQDIAAGNSRNFYQDFRSYVDCGDTLYAIVNEDLIKIKSFLRTRNLQSTNDSCVGQINSGIDRRTEGMILLIQFIGSSSTSGFGLYKTIDAEKTKFIKIN